MSLAAHIVLRAQLDQMAGQDLKKLPYRAPTARLNSCSWRTSRWSARMANFQRTRRS